MKLDKLFQLFVVKEKKFYPLYIEQASYIEKAAYLLVEILKEPSYEKRKELGREIKGIESKGDNVAQTIFEELYKTFVTPFDREDIQLLTRRMETFLDLINDTARKIVIYHPQNIDKIWLDIAEHIKEDALLVRSIVDELSAISKKSKSLMASCEKIKGIEHEVDELYEYYMSNLFETEKDPIELTKYKNIVQSLEDATDKARDIGDCIKTIIIKVG